MMTINHPDGFTNTDARRPICGVVAVAICSNRSLSECFNFFSERKKKYSNRVFTGPTLYYDRICALKHFNVDFIELKTPKPLVFNKFVSNMTVPDKLYMVQVRGHVVTVKNNIVIDQGEARHFSKHWVKRMQVRRVIEIL